MGVGQVRGRGWGCCVCVCVCVCMCVCVYIYVYISWCLESDPEIKKKMRRLDYQYLQN